MLASLLGVCLLFPACLLLSFHFCAKSSTSHKSWLLQCSVALLSPRLSLALSMCSPCMHGHWKENGGDRDELMREKWIRRRERETERSSICKDHSVTGTGLAS
ncbi:hypothetical protein GUJ93_ZPchr0004g39447 [Zizania palustris]|uniref:Secreted protein n=1 Tax=Zizania palustris TaxID=103762 RepID=A0A8J5T0K2_ZIZPA|nr:hypothetical protein GUJ93_ZPchr0004g39447 [Zizania palustris]